jgi:hypothetical protein
MGTLHSTDLATPTGRIRMSIGVALLVFGLFEHLLSARAIGGSYIAFRDHIAGFVLISIVFGAIIFIAGFRFWRGRSDISVLMLGVVNALLGLYVYLQRYHLHG